MQVVVVKKTTICCNSFFFCVFVTSQETGFWFIFHHVPTGPSEGLYSPGHSEHTPMGQFINNRAHSNYRVSVRVTVLSGETGTIPLHTISTQQGHADQHTSNSRKVVDSMLWVYQDDWYRAFTLHIQTRHHSSSYDKQVVGALPPPNAWPQSTTGRINIKHYHWRWHWLVFVFYWE